MAAMRPPKSLRRSCREPGSAASGALQLVEAPLDEAVQPIRLALGSPAELLGLPHGSGGLHIAGLHPPWTSERSQRRSGDPGAGRSARASCPP